MSFTNITNKSTQLIINGIPQKMITRKDFPFSLAQKVLSTERISVIGYGPQGRGQSLNLRDKGFSVCLGVRKSDDPDSSWQRAIGDEWVPGKDLFEIDEAADQGTIIQYLLSDYGQVEKWDSLVPHLKPGNALYFSHGFGVAFNKETKINPPKDIDVILVAPKGTGSTVRQCYLEDYGLNASYAIHQDFSGKARKKCLSLGIAIGAEVLFETSFHHEATSDLVGERSALGPIPEAGVIACYEVLREMGHEINEAYNESYEEFVASLFQYVVQKGYAGMYREWSTTAQRGALDHRQKYIDALKPIIREIYRDVADNKEARRVLNINSDPEYRKKLEKELIDIEKHEFYQAEKALKPYRH